jgi:predicted alpha/beta hydrolase family esterase
MPHQVLFIQGGGAGTHDEWDNKLVASLERQLGPDYQIRYPRMPDEGDPNYARWKAALKKEWAGLSEGAILLGHSIGGTFLINALAEEAPGLAVGAIVLIAAPFLGKGGWPSEEVETMPDLGARLPAGSPVYLYHGTDDETAPLDHADLYARAIPQAIVRRLPGRDHQLNDDMSEVAADIRRLGEPDALSGA